MYRNLKTEKKMKNYITFTSPTEKDWNSHLKFKKNLVDKHSTQSMVTFYVMVIFKINMKMFTFIANSVKLFGKTDLSSI